MPATTLAAHPTEGRIWLSLDGEMRQDSDISCLNWNVQEVISALSRLFTLQVPGALASVGAMRSGR